MRVIVSDAIQFETEHSPMIPRSSNTITNRPATITAHRMGEREVIMTGHSPPKMRALVGDAI